MRHRLNLFPRGWVGGSLTTLIFGILLGVLSCTPHPLETKLSIRDQSVVDWIDAVYLKDKGRPMPPGMAKRIFLGNRKSCERVILKHRGALENVVLAKQFRETRMDWLAVGLYDKLPPPKRSEGLSQIRRDVAEQIHGKPLGERELLDNVELNIDLGVQHLLWMRSLQRYNAGPRGARKGYGARYSLAVKQTLQGLPWRVKKQKEAVNEAFYFGLFRVVTGNAPGWVEPRKRLHPGQGGGVGKGGRRSHVGSGPRL